MLPESYTITEYGKIELEFTVEDETEEVTWFHDDVEIKPEKSR